MTNSHSPLDDPPRPAPTVQTFHPLDATSSTKSAQGLNLTPTSAQEVRIQFDALQSFEVVTQQFQSCGVTFHNAIAIVPSNPAFPSHLGQTVLMGNPKSGCLEASFEKPVRLVAGLVTASRRTIMAAYDAENRRIGQVATAAANLATSKSGIAPNTELRMMASNIHRVTFQAFDGQLTLGELRFSH